MISKEAYENEKEAIEAINVKDALRLTMPASQYMYEADKLFSHGIKDKEVLVSYGLDATIIDAIPKRNDAFRYAQSVWAEEHQDREQAAIEWNELRPQGEELKAVMLHNFRFAYRNDPNMQARLNRIADGSGNADTIQDLHDMAILGKENAAPLIAINYDVTTLDTAADLAVNMSKVLARANDNREETSQLRINRDKAFTHLKQAVDTVRDYGKFVFWRDENKLKGYRSDYFARKNKKSATSEIE